MFCKIFYRFLDRVQWLFFFYDVKAVCYIYVLHVDSSSLFSYFIILLIWLYRSCCFATFKHPSFLLCSILKEICSGM